MSDYKQKESLVVKKIEHEIDMDWSEIVSLLKLECNADHFRKVAKGIYEAYQYYNTVEESDDTDIDVKKDVDCTSHTVTINADSTETSEGKFFVDDETKLRDSEYLLKIHGYNPERFELVSAKQSRWNAPSGKILYSSKINVKPKAASISVEMIREWFNGFKAKPMEIQEHNPSYGSGDNILILPLVDFHWNLLSTEYITGNEYNKKIAAENFRNIISDTVSRTVGRNISKIKFVIGNDLFNANGINGSTFKGTQQDNESHIFEAYTELFELITSGIEVLKKLAPVDILYVPSNHDKEVTMYFMYTLRAQYKEDPDVSVDCSPLPRKYFRHGRTLFMFTHTIKQDAINRNIMAEASHMIDGVSDIQVMLAHLHNETVSDGIITIRRLPTTSGLSAWAKDKGYVGKQIHQSFVFNDKRGITDILYTSI